MFDKIMQFVGLFFFGFAVWLIAKDVEAIGPHRLIDLVLQTPIWVIAIALFFTVCDYAALAGYDFLSLNYIRKKLPVPLVLKASGIGFAISNTAGHAYASGGAIRYLFYTPAGVSKSDILKIIAFQSIMFFLGMGFAYAAATGIMLMTPVLKQNQYAHVLYFSVIVLLILFFLYYRFLIIPGKSFHVSGVDINAPTKRQTFGQLIIGLCDNIAVSIVFFSIFRFHLDADFLTVFSVFIIAQTIGIATQIPGGVGVFEGLFLYLYPHTIAQKPGILASLAVFRILYFFVPFFIASLYLGWDKLTRKRQVEKIKNP